MSTGSPPDDVASTRWQAIGAMTKAEAASCLARGAHVNGSWALALGGSSASGRIHGHASAAKCEAAIRRVLACDTHTRIHNPHSRNHDHAHLIRRVLARFDRAGQPSVGGGGTSFIAMSLFFFATHFAEIAGDSR